MTAPGPAQPTPGPPATPAPGAPAVPAPAGGQVNPPVPTPAPQQPAPQQPAALPAPAAPAALPVPAAKAPAAPAAPPPARTTKRARSTAGGGGGGYLVAVFALIIAVIAAAAAAYSLKISMDVRDGNAAAPLAEATPTPEVSGAIETATPTATPTPTATTPAGPEYTPELVRAEVRVPNPSGCTAAYVDVDTGTVGIDSGHEFYLSRCQNPSTLRVHVDRTSGRSTSGDDPSAEECGALVAGTPTSELVLEAEEGLTVCLITSRAQATAASLPQRLAIVEVLTVTTSEVRLALSTFRIDE